MISFYPGPSKVYSQSLDFIQEAYELGIPSYNHRSKVFMDIFQDIQSLVKDLWNLPADYHIAFTSSATEAWEIFIQSFSKKKRLNLHSGAFGEKWGNYYPENCLNQSIQELSIPRLGFDTVSMVHSETSNGSMNIPDRKFFGDAIIAVDATSSMGGMLLPWQEADYWLASVQKCMGMPAGLGIIIYNDKALQTTEKMNFYNDLSLIETNRKKNQTQHTPNVLMIYVFKRLLETLPALSEIHQKTLEKSRLIEAFMQNKFDYLIQNPQDRLPTVHAFSMEKDKLSNFLSTIEKENIILGKGYGKWKDSSFRIANFPSHTFEDLELLFKAIEKFY